MSRATMTPTADGEAHKFAAYPDRMESPITEPNATPILLDLESTAPGAGTPGTALNPERTRFDA